MFGNKLLARDIDVASQFSKEFDFDCVTKDGDIVNTRGGFEGGFRDDRDSKIGIIYKIRDITQVLEYLSFSTRLDSITIHQC